MSLDVSHSILQTPLATTHTGTIESAADRPARATCVVLVAACNEAERIGATLAAVREALPHAHLWVADDGSRDATASIAGHAGARVVRSERVIGKGGAVTAAARAALQELASAGAAEHGETCVFVLCDGDLGESARELGALAGAVARGEADVAVGAFASRVGGGLGIALGFARWAVRRRCGLQARAPISGQRALSARALADVLPFARGYGMELGMTIDAVRAGHRVVELELELTHRASGGTLAGFLHRARQLLDFVRVYLSRRNLRARSR
jgi:glycosyltransferase involved in cell wall biosynthesis